MLALQTLFFGTAALACPSLASLAQSASFKILGVVTQPDAPRGRALKLQPTPVKLEANRWNLQVWQPVRARDKAFVDVLSSLSPDLIIVAAYGQILPSTILDLPRFGCLNVHASLLPKYRGAAPIQWAILKDEAETGVTIMKMDPGLDTGPILTQQATPLLPSDNAQNLQDRLARLGSELLLATIPDYIKGKIVPQAQPAEGASYARKITKEDGHLNWNQPARVIWNQVRAFTPWPGALTYLELRGTRRLLKIWQAEVVESIAAPPGEIIRCDNAELVVGCGEKALKILNLQLEGGRPLTSREFLAGHKLGARQKLR